MDDFDNVLNQANTFVLKHKGCWNHYDWLQLLDALRNKTTNTDFMSNETFTADLGNYLEAVKLFYFSNAETANSDQLISHVQLEILNIFKQTDGKWNHIIWEQFLSTIQSHLFTLNYETQSYLGSILEHAKKLYFLIPKQPEIVNSIKTEQLVDDYNTKNDIVINKEEIRKEHSQSIDKLEMATTDSLINRFIDVCHVCHQKINLWWDRLHRNLQSVNTK